MEQTRIGTKTLGAGLIVFGVLFLGHILMPNISYLIIFHLWPVLFIGLGIEILIETCKANAGKFKLDFGSFFLIACLVLFAMGMAGFDYIITHFPNIVHY